jgi:predicted RNase H-like nuclease
MPLVGGADGTREGWVLVTKELSSGVVASRICTTEDLFYGEPIPDLVGLDIPIGLPDSGPRLCDLDARQRLRRRGSSVFPAPLRCLLEASTYPEACSLRFGAEGKKISRQTWGILPKIRIVDSLLRNDPALQQRVREVHPEFCFLLLAGHPMYHKKKSKQGQEERLRVLEQWFGEYLEAAVLQRLRLGCQLDDLLDAFAACWTAERIFSGQAETLPHDPPRDSAGLRMEIVG